MTETLISKVQSIGFDIDTLNLNGRVHRFRTTNKPNKKNGWYVGKIITLRGGKTLEVVTIGDWALGEVRTLTSRDDLTDIERKLFSASAKKMQEEMNKAQAEEREKAAELARDEWEKGQPIEVSFPYLAKKHIEGLPAIDFVKLNEQGWLMAPAENESGVIRSIQYISKDGMKSFLPGGEIKGNFFEIPGSGKRVIICEGFATGASIFSALEGNATVVVAFHAPNLFPVCSKMVLKHGAENISIAADDDRYNCDNAGLEYANKCLSLGVGVFVPDFTRFGYGSKPTDFNDLHCLGGLGAVGDQFLGQAPNREKLNVTLDASNLQTNKMSVLPINSEPKTDKVYSSAILWPSKVTGFYRADINPETQLPGKPQPQFHELAKYLHFGLNVRISDSEHLIFNGTHYEQIGHNQLLGLIHRLTLDQSRPEHLEKFIKIINAECDEGNFKFEPTDGLVNMKNGVLNIKTKEILPHSFRYDFRYVLPYPFEYASECPLWEKFLTEVFEGDKELISVVQEIFGYCLIGGEPFLHKAFMLYGTGRNGKSVFLKVLQAILGKTNYSNIPIESLDEKHVKASMIGKLANISPETSRKGIESATFKGISAGDEITDRHLYHGFFTFRLTCRLLFSGNFFPRFGDNSVGLNERLFILPFKRFFKPQEQDRGLFFKLVGELSGIFNWSIAGAERLLARGCLPSVKSVDDMADEYKRESCSVFSFYKEFCEVYILENPRALGDFYDDYKDFCVDNDVRLKREKKGFCMVLKNYLTQEVGHGATQKIDGGYLGTKFLIKKSEKLTYENQKITHRDRETKRRVIPNYAPRKDIDS